MELQKGDRVKLTDAGIRAVGTPLPSRYGTYYDTMPHNVSWADVVWDGLKHGHNGAGDNENLTAHWYVPASHLDVVKAAKRPRPSAPTFAADLRLKPQSKTILLHMKSLDHISPSQALITYGISRLAACIYDIRQAGHKVSTKVKQDAQGHKYAQYALVK